MTLPAKEIQLRGDSVLQLPFIPPASLYGAKLGDLNDVDDSLTTDGAVVTRQPDGSFALEPLPGGLGAPEWGDVTGTLEDQTDLASALDGKAAASHTHAIADTTGLQTALDALQEQIQPAIRSDKYYTSYAGNTQSTRTMAVGRLFYMPLIVPNAITVTRIGINVTTAVAGNARLGIYADADGAPSGAPILDAGTVSTGTTGEKELTVSHALVPGLYWLAVVTDAGCTVTAENLNANATNFVNLGVSSGSGSAITLAYEDVTFGSLPTVGTPIWNNSKVPPRVWVRNYVAPPAAELVSSSVNNSYPSGIEAGDIIVLFIGKNGGSATLPSGFTNLTNTINYISERACYKVASGSESGTIESGMTVVCCGVFRNVSAANIAATITSASVTVAAANSLVCVFGWSTGDGTSGDEISAPSGWTRGANSTPAVYGAAVLTNNTLQPVGAFSTAGVSITGDTFGRLALSIG